MKQSRLLQKLDTAIAEAKFALDADCLRSERALYLTRLGQRDEAKEIVASLHKRYDSNPNVKISGWLNLVEGLDIYFADMGGAAYDKVRRSHALSAAAGFTSLHALSAAWLAQLDYMRHDVVGMARHLHEALEFGAADHHGVQARASLVAAQALRHAGQEELASMWHKRAHEHATSEGDSATVSALIHNMAWLRMLMWRQSVLSGQDDSIARRHVLMSAESTDHFDDMVGSSSLNALHPLLRAQIFSLQGKPAEALAIYAEHLKDTKSLNASRLQGNLLADQAWCYIQLGHAESALEYAILAQDSITPQTHVDDKAATHSRLAQIYALLGNSEAESNQKKLASDAWEANHQLQTRVIDLIGSLHYRVSTTSTALTPPSAPTHPTHTSPPPAPTSAT